MSPIVFLDFDGVLNHAAWGGFGHEGTALFDPTCVARVDRICRSSRASVVVSSAWRTMTANRKPAAQLAWLRGLLYGSGLRHAQVIGVTPQAVRVRGRGLLLGRPRSEEIRAYLAKHPAERFVILDDEDDAEIPGHFVQTSFPGGGLKDEHVGRAIEILGGVP